MLEALNTNFTILSTERAASENDIEKFKEKFPFTPDEYINIVRDSTEIELLHVSGKYVRIWGPLTSIDQDSGYQISNQITGSIPIGDNGGGSVLLYIKKTDVFGLYIASYEELEIDEVVWIASNLKEFLCDDIGATRLDD